MTESHDPTDLLQDVLDRDAGDFVELRYHRKRTRSVSVEKGRVDQARVAEHTGVGVRVLADGTWGFASTDRVDEASVKSAVDSARRAARASAAARREKTEPLPEVELARGQFETPGTDELVSRPLEETLDMVLRLEQQARGASTSIESAGCGYTEVFEEKGIVTSDGAKAWTRIARPEFRVMAVAQKDGEIGRASCRERV